MHYTVHEFASCPAISMVDICGHEWESHSSIQLLQSGSGEHGLEQLLAPAPLPEHQTPAQAAPASPSDPVPASSRMPIIIEDEEGEHEGNLMENQRLMQTCILR